MDAWPLTVTDTVTTLLPPHTQAFFAENCAWAARDHPDFTCAFSSSVNKIPPPTTPTTLIWSSPSPYFDDLLLSRTAQLSPQITTITLTGTPENINHFDPCKAAAIITGQPITVEEDGELALTTTPEDCPYYQRGLLTADSLAIIFSPVPPSSPPSPTMPALDLTSPSSCESPFATDSAATIYVPFCSHDIASVVAAINDQLTPSTTRTITLVATGIRAVSLQAYIPTMITDGALR